MRILVGIASVAITAFVAYYFWTEYKSDLDNRQVAAFSMQRDRCLRDLESFTNQPDNKDRKTAVEVCLTHKYLVTADLEAALARKRGS